MTEKTKKKCYRFSIVTAILFLLLGIITKLSLMDGFNLVVYDVFAKFINAPMTIIMKAFSAIGEWYSYVLLSLIILLLKKTRIPYGIPCTGILTISAVLNVILKKSFSIDRPNLHRLIPETGFGFPSGHASDSFAYFGFFAYLLFINSDNKNFAKTMSIIFAIYVFMVGASRVYLGVHNCTDIIGGYLISMSLISLCVVIWELVDKDWLKNLKFGSFNTNSD